MQKFPEYRLVDEIGTENIDVERRSERETDTIVRKDEVLADAYRKEAPLFPYARNIYKRARGTGGRSSLGIF
jgi:hypothetical protein